MEELNGDGVEGRVDVNVNVLGDCSLLSEQL